MPIRSTPLVSQEIYHVINRGIAGLNIFLNKSDYTRFIKTFQYYNNEKPPTKFSNYRNLYRINPKILLKFDKPKKPIVEIIAFCLMPTHFHFLIKQLNDNGISEFLRKIANSYARCFNTKYKRRGPLYEGRFKAIRIESENQLLHVNRYIHLNPYSSRLLKDLNQLFTYTYSSLPEYLNFNSTNICSKDIIFSHFKDLEDYKKFIMDQADYQQSLEEIKHHLLD